MDNSQGVIYSTDKDCPVMEDVFWLFNPQTNLGLAAFKFDGVIYVAVKERPDWSASYMIDTANPLKITEDVIEKFIAGRKKEGLQVIFNVLKGEYSGIQGYTAKDVKDNITLTLSGCSHSNRRMVSFNFRNVKDLKVTEATEKREESLRELFAMEDLDVPNKAQETLSHEQVIHRYEKITESLRPYIKGEKIEVPIFICTFKAFAKFFTTPQR